MCLMWKCFRREVGNVFSWEAGVCLMGKRKCVWWQREVCLEGRMECV